MTLLQLVLYNRILLLPALQQGVAELGRCGVGVGCVSGMCVLPAKDFSSGTIRAVLRVLGITFSFFFYSQVCCTSS